MKKKYYFILFFCFPFLSFSQVIQFQRTIGDANYQTNGIAWQTSDGGYIVNGSTNVNSSSGGDIFLMKTDSVGNKQWLKTYGDTNEYDASYCIPTMDNGYLLGVNEAYGVLLIKTDINGDTLWVKKNTSYQGAINYIFQSTPGAYFLVYGGGALSKIDNMGNMLWTKYYDKSGSINSGRGTADGGLILCGTKIFNSGLNSNATLIKTDSAGEPQWEKVFGIINANNESGNDVCITGDGGYALLGGTDYLHSGPTGGQAMVIKTDSTGNPQWTKTYGGTFDTSPYQIEAVSGGAIGFVYTLGTTGETENNPPPQNSIRTSLLNIDINGNYVWGEMYGGMTANKSNSGDLAFNLSRTKDGGYLLSGESQSFCSQSGDFGDIWIVKTDGNGISGCNELLTAITVVTPTLTITSSPGWDTTRILPLTNATITIGTWQAKDSVLCPTSNSGVNELTQLEEQVSVYPNPTQGQFAITSERFKINNVEVYNVFGEKVYSAVVNHPSSVINISSQPQGIYFIRANISEGMISKKILLIK